MSHDQRRHHKAAARSPRQLPRGVGACQWASESAAGPWYRSPWSSVGVYRAEAQQKSHRCSTSSGSLGLERTLPQHHRVKPPPHCDSRRAFTFLSHSTYSQRSYSCRSWPHLNGNHDVSWRHLFSGISMCAHALRASMGKRAAFISSCVAFTSAQQRCACFGGTRCDKGSIRRIMCSDRLRQATTSRSTALRESATRTQGNSGFELWLERIPRLCRPRCCRLTSSLVRHRGRSMKKSASEQHVLVCQGLPKCRGGRVAVLESWCSDRLIDRDDCVSGLPVIDGIFKSASRTIMQMNSTALH